MCKFEESLAEGKKAVYIDRWESPIDSISLSEIFLQTNHSEMSAFYARASQNNEGACTI